MDFEKQIKELLIKEGVEKEDLILEIPSDSKLGDYAFPCFVVGKKLGKNPFEIASDLSQKIKIGGFLKQVISHGGYVNFFIDRKLLIGDILNKVLKETDSYGSEGWGGKEKILIELVEPNTNKPLHLGHLRNAFLGMSVAQSFEFLGNEVIKTNLVNDRGIHIMKSMLAYDKWGKKATPESLNVKPDKFVGDFYVLFNQKSKKEKEGVLEGEAQKLLQKWEEGDGNVMALWKQMNDWVLDGMAKTYKKIGLIYNKEYFESDLYKEGKGIVLEGLKKGVFVKDDDGSIYVDLGKGLGKKILLRGDGTSLYITQDLYLAKVKFDDYKMDRSIYVVGNEQDYHFKVLFKILKLLGFKFADKCYHLSYGMVNLPSGKMKSREGLVVDADDIIEEVIELAKLEIKKRYESLSSKEIDFRAEIIGMGGLKFYLLKIDSKKDMVYNPEESISFEGDTGPYVQYSYARIKSILKKVSELQNDVDYGLLKESVEFDLVRKIGCFNEVVLKSVKDYKPNLICNYLIGLCRDFNRFYGECPVLKVDDGLKMVRLNLLKSVAQVLKNGLGLLGIDVLEEM